MKKAINLLLAVMLCGSIANADKLNLDDLFRWIEKSLPR